METQKSLFSVPHRRKNILTGEWILVSPHRTQRPWQGEESVPVRTTLPTYDPTCYLCPGNIRANGERNPQYTKTFVFTNDFSALLPNVAQCKIVESPFFCASTERGICRVVNYTPYHNQSLAEMSIVDIRTVVDVWCEEFLWLSKESYINYIQIFENKGTMMGNSNPHPHCQIWAQEHIPTEVKKEQRQFRAYYVSNQRNLLLEYIREERRKRIRIVFENETFIVLVPFWAIWPFETLVAPKKRRATILELTPKEKNDFAEALSVLTVKYDNVFHTSFPYSAGIHQSPTDGKEHPEWHMHMHFYPPLLRSATIRKFMVGYEMLAEPQRDLTPEYCATILRGQSNIHYKQSYKQRKS
ncbi:MAG: UDP-glucose--hexose-1-phosphate uridylyltransferase [Bacteroidetes bacterium]|nr:UDP-glucose--hexose-1-phosphate uridylyltransferase [Bacteroidota bacterium]